MGLRNDPLRQRRLESRNWKMRGGDKLSIFQSPGPLNEGGSGTIVTVKREGVARGADTKARPP